MLLRDKVLVEKCINTVMWDYNRDKTSDINALQDLQLTFMEFLAVNTEEQVEYGLEYMSKEYPNEQELLKPIILEYKTFGFTQALADLVPQVEVQEKVKQTNTWSGLFKHPTATCEYIVKSDAPTITQEMPETTECPVAGTEPLPINMFNVTEQKMSLASYWKDIFRKIWG